MHKNNLLRVVCVCGGFGFPIGTASSKRIYLIGKSLTRENTPFYVWHIGPSPFKENKQKSGIYHGIQYEYLSPKVRWPQNYLIRILFYCWGFMLLPFKLLFYRCQFIVYCYYQGGILDLWTLLLCRLFGVPVIQEACEWWPGSGSDSAFTRWMYRKCMFRLSNGAMPISSLIEQRIRGLSIPGYGLLKVPALIDSKENHSIKNTDNSNDFAILWCGMADGYKKDILFILDSMTQLVSNVGKKSIFRIVGPCSESFRQEAETYAERLGIEKKRVDIRGFVSEKELWSLCCQANVLIMPLWCDDRSNTRFPTKLGQYLASNRPVVTSLVGEICYFLSNETAITYIAGNSKSLSQAIDYLAEKPEHGEKIAEKARRDVLPLMEYTFLSEKIQKFFKEVYMDWNQRR